MQTSIRLNRCKNGIDRSEVLIDRSVGSFFANVFEFGENVFFPVRSPFGSLRDGALSRFGPVKRFQGRPSTIP